MCLLHRRAFHVCKRPRYRHVADPKKQIYADGAGMWHTMFSGTMDCNDRCCRPDDASPGVSQANMLAKKLAQPPRTGWLCAPGGEVPSTMRIVFNADKGSNDP